MYNLIFDKNADKEFSKLSLEIQNKIRKSINEKLLVNPDVYLIRLYGFNLYKFRVGDYRILIKKQVENLVLIAVKVGHRKNVYDNLNKFV